MKLIKLENYRKMFQCIYVDGACNKNTDGSGWGSVVDNLGKDLIDPKEHSDLTIEKKKLPKSERNIIIAKANDVVSQQNNFAELLAMVVGLRIALKSGQVYGIYSDSQLIVSYWSLGHVNPKTWKSMDPIKQKYINECKELRSQFEKVGGKIIKISGNDNIADLGYHK